MKCKKCYHEIEYDEDDKVINVCGQCILPENFD